MFDFRAERAFKKLDKDNSGGLDKDEIKEYLKESMGDDWNEEEFEKEYNQTFNVSLDDDDDATSIEEWKIIFKKMAHKVLDDMKKENNEANNIKSPI